MKYNHYLPTTTDLQYAPVTSVDVKRSFSKYKNILTDRRTKMTPNHTEHMKQNIVVNCFLKRELS
jgi:hypothetical protein